MYKYLKDQKGAALVTIILVMVVLMILGVSLLSTSLAEAKHAIRQEQQTQAHYIARSGADAVASYILNNPSGVTSLITNATEITENIGNGNFKAIVTGDINSTIIITSNGEIHAGAVSETVVLELESHTNAPSIFENVIYANNDYDVSKMNTTGPLQSGGEIKAPVGYSPAPKPYQYVYYSSPVFPTGLPYMGVLDNGTHANDIIDSNSEYSTIDVSNNSTLTFDASLTGGILHVVVNNLENKGDIQVTGGKVFLYVKNRMEITTSGNVNSGPGTNPSNLSVFIADGGTFYTQSGQGFKGFIYGPNATITIDSSNVDIIGAIIGNIFNDNNNATVDFYIPDPDLDYGGIILNLQKTLYSN